jgi:hypothetical protein
VDGSELARVIFTSAALVGAAMCSAFECGSHDTSRRVYSARSLCFFVQNRKNGPGQRMGEIANCLAYLADWTKPTAKLHSWFSDIGRPRLKA